MKMKSKKKIILNPKIKKEFNNKTVLITGGAGSVGSVLAEKILQYHVKSLRILDINEHALFTLGRSIKDPRLRLLLGSILDRDRIELACKNVDYIFHAAAIKNKTATPIIKETILVIPVLIPPICPLLFLEKILIYNVLNQKIYKC